MEELCSCSVRIKKNIYIYQSTDKRKIAIASVKYLYFTYGNFDSF